MNGRWRAIGVATGAIVITVAAVHEVRQQREDLTASEEVRTVVNQYCVDCHNNLLQIGDFALDAPEVWPVAQNPDVWERVVRKLHARLMPPAGEQRFDDATYVSMIASLEATLDAEAARNYDPGSPLIRRLNRAEYANAIRDLLALKVDAALLLPADDSAYGFDNVSEVLKLSPALQERYLSAARKISALAVGDPEIAPVESSYRLRQDLSQNRHIEGMPLGTIGGRMVEHMFPLDGEYLLQARLFRTNLGMMRGLEREHEIEYTIDGKRVHLATIGGNYDIASAFEAPTQTGDEMEARLRFRTQVDAGLRRVGIGFVEYAPRLDTVRLQPFLRSSYDTLDWTGRPHLEVFSISGPFNASGSGDTESRRRVFECWPTSEAEEQACAERILESLLRRAYRRPPTDQDLARALRFYEDARQRDGTFQSGIQAGLQYVLASPNFTFRIERDPADAAPGTVYPVSEVELASRLSFFLWSSIPDDELLDVAEQGGLAEPAELERQVRRMLADPRSDALVANFAGQWLQLRNVESISPNSTVFPNFDDNLRQALRRETELFFRSIMEEDRSVIDLLSADYTFVNERLARHYGIAHVSGSEFRRVPVVSEARRGLLGHGSIMALTSHAERTAPTLRGKWILDNLLGTPPPPPPPDVPGLEETHEQASTLRERLEQHRESPVCASCHDVMDPLGLALENFDAVGAWRTTDDGAPIDASGELADGTVIDGVVSLREALLERPEQFVSTMTEKMMIYALGRGIRPRDMSEVRAIVRQAAEDNYRFSSLVLGIVNSAPFRTRKKPEA